MHIDVLVAEIGSTTTVVNAFDLTHCRFLGQGQAPTSVLAGDVRVGLREATDDLRARLGAGELSWGEMFATSSAAGGLRMTVHGLIYDMTVRAAREAALGAGGIIGLATAGRLRRTDLERIREARPNLILLAGGTDYGERDTAIMNAELLVRANLGVPVVYAGNVENQREIELMFGEAGQTVYLTENVYPKLDELNIEPTRRIIHRVFEEHIVRAPGMEHIRDMVSGSIIPTPGAVMECAQLLYTALGDLIVFDVGGATTDVHSVTDGSDEIAALLVQAEPRAKRTVEGDLGVYVNARNVAEQIGMDKLSAELGFDAAEVLLGYHAIPKNDRERALVSRLTEEAARTALERHAGRLRHVYSPTGRKTLAEGKDLSQVKWLIATGGALTRLPGRAAIMDKLAGAGKGGMMLFPREGATRTLFDEDYILASLGVLSHKYPEEALILAKKSLDL